MFKYKWKKGDGYPDKGIDYHGLKVYSTFACGGGSTMGYKLAGYDVIGANDIDPEMARVYKANHNPKFYDLCPIKDLLTKDLPKEYYELDVLDGSPPCSTFSIAGSREKAWKVKKKFREGQAEQELSDLFFDWISLVEKLQPKIAVAENVKGMLFGNAKAYTLTIIKELNSIGYDVQLFSLNAATMGVPQARERVFFLCKRRDLNLANLKLNFKLEPIYFKDLENTSSNPIGNEINDTKKVMWEKCLPGKAFSTVHPRGSYFNSMKVAPNKVLNTITASRAGLLSHYKYPNELSDEIFTLAGTFPIDYDFLDLDVKYLVGMSVPPVMMAQVADQIYKQWLSKLAT